MTKIHISEKGFVIQSDRDSVTELTVDGDTDLIISGHGSLKTILRHLDAIPVLIRHANSSGDAGRKALSEWDSKRNKFEQAKSLEGCE